MRKTNPTIYKPKKCWVGGEAKICYTDEAEAAQAARLNEFERGLPTGFLTVYKCEYGNHYHLASKNKHHVV